MINEVLKQFPDISITAKILGDYSSLINKYLDDYSKGKAIRSTMAADLINRLHDVDAIAFIATKTILNSMWSKIPIIAMYKAIGQRND